MRQVYSAEHPTEAHMVRGILEAKGIECVVRGEILFGARGELPVTPETAPSVWVVEEGRYAEARQIVAQYEKANRQDVPEGQTWQCQSCKEMLEEQFTHCWNCGTPRFFPS
jgi:hypothetical protein